MLHVMRMKIGAQMIVILLYIEVTFETSIKPKASLMIPKKRVIINVMKLVGS
jgi:hypothetical protein